MVIAAMQVFAFLEFPILTTMHAYTVGLFFGIYNPFFYFYLFLKSFILVFPKQNKKILVKKMTSCIYWALVFAILLTGSTVFYFYKFKDLEGFGKTPWKSFDYWFTSFKSNTPLIPPNTHGGILGTFLFSVFSSFLSPIGTIIFGVILIIFTIVVGFRKQIKDSIKKMLESKKEEKISDSNSPSPTNKQTLNKSTQKQPLPFEDPFEK